MSLPALSNWEKTRRSLHQAATALGAIRVASIDPLPNDLQFSMSITPRGLSTGQLRFGGELLLDYPTATVTYLNTANSRFDNGESLFKIALDGLNQVSLMDALVEGLKSAGHVVDASRKRITETAPFELDLSLAADYAQVIDRVFTAVSRFRGRLSGAMTPVVVWPHHFDLSFLWFAGAGSDEHHDPHMNFGFSPESPGFERPYVYVYAWPMNEAIHAVEAPPPARWNRENWTGLVIDYDTLSKSDDPDALLEYTLLAIHRAIAPHMQPAEG